MSEPLAPVDLLLVWHHHQPDYRRPFGGGSVLPWARLHAAKDYLDMARHLERHPGVRATFNLVPSLVDQIEAAAAGAPDDLFDRLARPPRDLSPADRAAVVSRCAQAPDRASERWPGYRALRRRVVGAPAGPGNAAVLTDLEVLGLEVGFLLAWVDPMFHGEPEAAAALARHPDWTERHRDGLLALHRRLAAQVIPAYRALAGRGQIELSTSPYHHPILPLLVDLASARRARPAMALPAARLTAPEDARRQIEQALERHAAIFGARPAGMWPSEGSVSPEVVGLAAAAGVRWLASDEGVLRASIGEGAGDRGAHYRPWRVATEDGEVTLFFRDHALSDRIGFVYSRWDAVEAAADFIARLRRIARDHRGAAPPLVTVILDGENCWEHYREDGNPFLEALYGALEQAGDIRTRTPSEVLADPTPAPTLERLHSGSWIDADFHIWIGHPEKNRAWEAVAGARQALVDAGVTHDRAPAAWQALYRAQGSDWFWWFGDDHHTPDRPVFDRLFRDLVSAAYVEGGLEPPASLRLPIARAGMNAGQAEDPIGFLSPTIDGRRSTFYEWHAAGRCVPGGGGAMHRGAGLVREIHYGFDLERFYLRVDFIAPTPPGDDVDLRLEIVEPRLLRLRVAGLSAGERRVLGVTGGGDEREMPDASCSIGSLLELAVPFASLGLASGESVTLLVQAMRAGHPVEGHPGETGIVFTVPGPHFDADHWSV